MAKRKVFLNGTEFEVDLQEMFKNGFVPIDEANKRIQYLENKLRYYRNEEDSRNSSERADPNRSQHSERTDLWTPGSPT